MSSDLSKLSAEVDLLFGEYKIFYVAYFILTLLDFLTTYYAVTYTGIGVELNPIVAPYVKDPMLFLYRFFIINIVIIGLVVIPLIAIYWSDLLKPVLVGLVMLEAVFVGNNLDIILSYYIPGGLSWLGGGG